MSQTEVVIIELEGGPIPGRATVEAPEWPLPRLIEVVGEAGAYVKFRESQLPAGIPGILRGASFKWHSDYEN